MRDKMEYKGLWEKDEIPDIIYKVTEFYEWHNTDPVIISTIFINKEVARRFFNQRLKEIPYEVWDNDEEYIKERVRTEEYGEDNICLLFVVRTNTFSPSSLPAKISSFAFGFKV